MKKITVFAGVLAASALVGTSAAWAAPVPATAGSSYAVTSAVTQTSTSAATLTLACNSGDSAEYIEVSPTNTSTLQSGAAWSFQATDSGTGTASLDSPTTTTNAAGEVNSVSDVLTDTAGTGTVTGSLICLARSTVAAPATAPSMSGPGGAY